LIIYKPAKTLISVVL